MKKLIIIAAVCFTSHICLAQITNLFVNSNPPGALLDWSNKDLTYIVAQGAAGGVDTAVIKTTLKTTDGTIVATTDLARARVRKLFISGTGVAVFYAADVIPLEVMVFNGKFKTSMDRSGKLPAGTYQICVRLVRPISFQPVGEERCSFFTVAAFQLPIPMMPANETILDIEKAKAVITFRWTPVAPRPSGILTYRVTVFEILPTQTAMQALRSNQPLLTKDIVGTTQFIWQPQLGLTMCGPGDKQINNVTDSTKKMERDTLDQGTGSEMDAYAFIWTIQTFDQQHRPFGDGNINGDGISEPNVFFIDRRPPPMRKSGPPSRVSNLNRKRN